MNYAAKHILSMLQGKLLIPLAVLAFLALLIALAYSGMFAWRRYRAEMLVRLDPAENPFYAAANSAVPEKRPEGRRRIVFFGDSRIRQWDPLPAWDNAEILNRGISGQTTGQIRLRLENDVLALKPDLVVLQMGANDLKTIGLFPAERQAIADRCEANIRFIATTLAANQIRVLLLTIFPTSKPELLRRPIWSKAIGDSIDHVNRNLLQINDPLITLLDCDAILRNGRGRYIDPAFALDTLHLNREAYEQLNKALEDWKP